MKHEALLDSTPFPYTSRWLGIPYPFSDLPPGAQQEILTRMVEEMGRAMRDTMRPGAARAPETPAPPTPVPLRPEDEPLTDVRLAETLGPLLAQIAGLTEALHQSNMDEVSHDQLRAVHGRLAGHAAAAQTFLRRWWNDRQED